MDRFLIFDRDTIAAVATPSGAGGIGVIRLSGPAALTIAQKLTGKTPQVRFAHYARFHDSNGQIIDDGLLLYFPAPGSYTGEAVVELQAHGSPVLLQALLARALELGARQARPGEFTERAFLNGKLDLAQAEAVADLISAGSAAAARAARRSLDGVFSRRANALAEAVLALRMHIEAAIDFPEEEIDFLADETLITRLSEACSQLHALTEEALRGQRLMDGLHVVIVGPPNAGKSSLLNVLAGSERAIVTDIPGTTRDLVSQAVTLDGITLTLVDTAGLREDSADPVECEGMRRARAEMARADLVLAVLDIRTAQQDRPALEAELKGVARVLWVYNKSDLAGESAPPFPAIPDRHRQNPPLWLSAHTGKGLETLAAAIRRTAQADSITEGTFSARARHVDALRRASAHLHLAYQRLASECAGELAAEELRLAHQALGEITGQISSDDLLGRIFANFCIGK